MSNLATETLVLHFNECTATPNSTYVYYDGSSIDVSPQLISQLGDIVFVVEVTFSDGNTFGTQRGYTEQFACTNFQDAKKLVMAFNAKDEDQVDQLLRETGNAPNPQCFGYFADIEIAKLLAFEVVKA